MLNKSVFESNLWVAVLSLSVYNASLTNLLNMRVVHSNAVFINDFGENVIEHALLTE